ncbi:TPA: fimbria/pilus outer membrane usher protein, partial [Vibrio cholerae O1]
MRDLILQLSKSSIYSTKPSDDYMDAESIQGYAPVVRGIAKSNAKVIIKQSGYVIY